MSTSSYKMNMFQALMILMLSNGLACHVIVNPMLLDASGRDAWITVISAGAFFIPWSLLLYYMMKKSSMQNWQSWLARHTHPALSWILLLPVCIHLYLIGLGTVIQTANWSVSNYLPASSAFQLAILLVLICLLLASWGIRIIAIASGVLLPVVIILGFFVGISNSSVKDYTLLMPVLEHGWRPVINGLVYAGSAYMELLALLLLQHHIRGKVKPWHLLLYSSFIVIMMNGPVIGAITEFGPLEAAMQMTSPYEQWRLLRIGQYVEHLDFFSIFQWLSGASIRVSLPVFILADVLPLRSSRKKAVFILAVMASYLVYTILPANNWTLYLLMFDYFMPISLAVLLPLSLIWSLCAAFAKPDRRNANESSKPDNGPPAAPQPTG